MVNYSDGTFLGGNCPICEIGDEKFAGWDVSRWEILGEKYLHFEISWHGWEAEKYPNEKCTGGKRVIIQT